MNSIGKFIGKLCLFALAGIGLISIGAVGRDFLNQRRAPAIVAPNPSSISVPTTAPAIVAAPVHDNPAQSPVQRSPVVRDWATREDARPASTTSYDYEGKFSGGVYTHTFHFVLPDVNFPMGKLSIIASGPGGQLNRIEFRLVVSERWKLTDVERFELITREMSGTLYPDGDSQQHARMIVGAGKSADGLTRWESSTTSFSMSVGLENETYTILVTAEGKGNDLSDPIPIISPPSH